MNTTGRRGRPARLLAGALVLGGALLSSNSGVAQGPDGAKAPARPSTLGLDEGTIALETPDFHLRLVASSQTVAALAPRGAADFDFTPVDQLAARSANGFYHLGDLTLRVRAAGSSSWRTFSTADDRQPVKALPVSGTTLASADLQATLPVDSPLQVTRSWSVEDGTLVLRFALTNGAATPVEIGGLGIPLIFNNFITDRTLEQAHAICSFSDPATFRSRG